MRWPKVFVLFMSLNIVIKLYEDAKLFSHTETQAHALSLINCSICLIPERNPFSGMKVAILGKIIFSYLIRNTPFLGCGNLQRGST